MQWPSADGISVENAPSLEELAGAIQLVHDPESWEADDQEDEESQAELQSEVDLGQTPLDLNTNSNERPTEKVEGAAFDPEAELEDETRAVEKCSPGPYEEEEELLVEEEPASGSMPFDQLPHLSPEALHPKKTSANSKFKKRQAAFEPPPATLFDVHPLLEFARTHFNLTAPRASPFHKPAEFDLTKRLEWEKKLISTPLTRLPKNQAAIAVQAFRNVSGFMGNRASGKNQIDHCFKLLRNVVP